MKWEMGMHTILKFMENKQQSIFAQIHIQTYGIHIYMQMHGSIGPEFFFVEFQIVEIFA